VARTLNLLPMSAEQKRTTASVRAASHGDVAACVEIVRALPDFFTDDVPEKVRKDLAKHSGWVVAEADAVVGFAVVARRAPRAAEILWAAVVRDRRFRRLGTRLIEHVLERLRTEGVDLVEVKTLDPSAGYAPYVATHAFWAARGFVQLDTIDPLPGWPAGNPAAILAAALAPTR